MTTQETTYPILTVFNSAQMYDFQGDVSTVYTGDTDLAKAGLLATYNRSPKLPHWDLPCGQVNDSSDGTKFPSFIHPNDSLLFYRKSMCRSMPLVSSVLPFKARHQAIFKLSSKVVTLAD